MDDVAGGLHALFLLHAPQATRFLFDVPFYHHNDHPYVRRLRREFLEELRRTQPEAIVLFDYEGRMDGGFDRLTRFPALALWLENGYRLAREGDRFRLFIRRGESRLDVATRARQKESRRGKHARRGPSSPAKKSFPGPPPIPHDTTDTLDTLLWSQGSGSPFA
jgi:hypothetical protein